MFYTSGLLKRWQNVREEVDSRRKAWDKLEALQKEIVLLEEDLVAMELESLAEEKVATENLSTLEEAVMTLRVSRIFYYCRRHIYKNSDRKSSHLKQRQNNYLWLFF